MSRYIEAESIRDFLIRSISLTNGIDTALRDAPSIDLVFCEECIHFTKLSDGWGRCNAHDRIAQTIDFCSWGERKESE